MNPEDLIKNYKTSPRFCRIFLNSPEGFQIEEKVLTATQQISKTIYSESELNDLDKLEPSLRAKIIVQTISYDEVASIRFSRLMSNEIEELMNVEISNERYSLLSV